MFFHAATAVIALCVQLDSRFSGAGVKRTRTGKQAPARTYRL